MGQFFIKGYAAEELEKLSPANIVGLKVGQQRYAVLTNRQGGIIDDVIITRIEQGFNIVVNAVCKSKVVAHLQLHLSKHFEVQERQDLALFALQGPAANIVMEKLSQQASKLRFMHACYTQIVGMECLVSRCGYTGEDGFEISIANKDAEALAIKLLSFEQVAPIGLGARDTLRLEAGLSLYGHELDETIGSMKNQVGKSCKII